MKPLLVGQAPSKSHGKKRAFDGPSGRRLAKLVGLSLEELLVQVDTVNLLPKWPGKHRGKYAYREKGDRFPVRVARRGAKRVTAQLAKRRRRAVVLCGRRVALAFGLRAQFLEFGTRTIGKTPVLFFPHPSGCNLWWNRPRNRRRAREAFWKVIFG